MIDTLDPPIQLLSTEEFMASQPEGVRWLWDDYLASGMVTLFTSHWKAGKTTILSVLLARWTRGETFAGSAVIPGRVAIVTEEPAAVWKERHGRLHLAPNIEWCSRPFVGRPTFAQWEKLIAKLATAQADLVIIDTLAKFLPGAVENSPSGLLAALGLLQHLTNAGTAVMLVHHPRKGGPAGEISPRGSGALSGFADILVDYACLPNLPATDRKHRLRAISRHRGHSTRIVELNKDGTDYDVIPAPPEVDGFEAGWPIMKGMFEDNDERYTRRGMLKNWPQDYDKPSKATLRRWLDQAEREGLVERRGTGRNRDPFRYALPGHEDLLKELPPLEPLKKRLYGGRKRKDLPPKKG